MKLKITTNLHNYISECQTDGPNLRECEYILDKISQGQVSQIIFDFGKSTILCLLYYFQSVEDFKVCDLIVKKIQVHNKVHNTNIKV